MILAIVAILIFSAYAWLIIYYRESWLKIPVQDEELASIDTLHTTISVIIPARNEEKNIQDCLQSLACQAYPKHLFEVMVIDDHSTDATAEITKSFNQNISLIPLIDFAKGEDINSYKKKAIEVAISKARGELIVTTDADCVTPTGWLQTIAAFYEKHRPAFIAAPVGYSVPYLKKEKSFLKIFQSLDFMTLQGITGAAVYKKFHTMCNGANLAYEKKAFYEVQGFKGIDTIASGDDMLLMDKIYHKYPDRVLFLKSEKAIVETKPVNTINDFFQQRIRWASKSDKYKDKKITAILMFVYTFNLWLLVLGIFSFFSRAAFYLFIGSFFAKIVCELFFLYPVAKFFKKEKMLWWFPLAQPFHIVYVLIAGWLGKFGSYKWKERKVR